MSDVEERVKKVVVELLQCAPEDVTRWSSFVDLGASEDDMEDIYPALEEEFDIEIPDGEAEKMTTVGAAIDYVESKR
ncbi:acyl carrier protein [Streptomyces spiramyceticus]|uniref:acyl carrier protein n=1 Tax=Streptomyces spiramyceticus TaxID=299717 RepID=UPI00237AEBA2|nr:acyl carrier protein [Streptomyces spiramyceticus]